MATFRRSDDFSTEDNTPLQAQQDDRLTNRQPFESSTGETVLSAATMENQNLDVETSWDVARTLDSDIPTIVSTLDWTTGLTFGSLLTAPATANGITYLSPNPVILPYHLVNPGSTQESGDGGYSVDGNTGTSIFGALFRRHALYQSGFVVEVSINGTQFHGGSLFVVAIPAPHLWMAGQNNIDAAGNRYYTFLEFQNKAQLGIFPSARLMPRSNSAVQLDLPYIGQNPTLATEAMDAQWGILTFVETPLTIPTSGTAPTLTVHVKVAPKNAKFWGPHFPTMPYARLAHFGNVTWTQNPVPQMRISTGEAAFFSLESRSAGMLAQRTRVPSESFLPPRTESFKTVLSIPTVHAVVDSTSATADGVVLYQTDVAPNAFSTTTRETAVGSVTQTRLVPFLADFARYFTQWRGSIVFTIQYTGPAVASGRVLLAFQPGATRQRKSNQSADYILQGNTQRVLTTGPHEIWDLSNSSSVSFECPYSVPSPWASVNPVQGGISVNNNSSSGTFYMALLTPINTPTVVQPTSTFVIHVSGGADFDLRHPGPIPIIQTPLYNGVLDQGPVDPPVVIGQHVQEPFDDLGVEKFFSRVRFYGSYNLASNNTAGGIFQIPLTFVDYAPPSSGTNYTISATTPAVPFRAFASLFTFFRADIRVMIALPATGDWIVAYRPPGAPPTVYTSTSASFGSQNPSNLSSLLNAGATILSTRASNFGMEVIIPFDSFANVFQTSNNRIQQTDTRYVPSANQFDPGSMGTLYVASRAATMTTQTVEIALGLVNVSAYIPRPFAARVGTGNMSSVPQPAALSDESFVDEPSEARSMEKSDWPTQGDDGVIFHMPVRSHDPWTCPCVLCTLWRDDPLTPEEEDWKEEYGYYPFTVVDAYRAGFGEALEDDDDSWEVASILEGIECTIMNQECDNRELSRELPEEYPEGPAFSGMWIDTLGRLSTKKRCGKEWYRLLLVGEFHDRPNERTMYDRQVRIYTPLAMERHSHSLLAQAERNLRLAGQAPVLARQMWIDLWTNTIRCISHNACIGFYVMTRVHEILRLLERCHDTFEAGRQADQIVDEGFSEEQVPLRVRGEEWQEDEDFFSDGEYVVPPRFESRAELLEEAYNTHENNEEKPYVYRVNRGVYNHWGIAYKGQAISLKQRGLNAVVSYTPEDLEKAVKVEDVGFFSWLKAILLLEQTFEGYNIMNNCTHFVEILTGNSYQNTGTWLMAGLAIAAVATAVVFHSPSNWDETNPMVRAEQVADHVYDEPRPVEPTPKKTTRREWFPKRCMFFWKKKKPIYMPMSSVRFEAPINVQLTNPTLEANARATSIQASQTLREYQEMAPVITAAVTNTAAAMQDTSIKASEILDKFEGLINSVSETIPKIGENITEATNTLTGEFAKKIGSLLLKTIGYVLIIFGNPNPATIAGIVALMSAEVLDSPFLRQKIKSAFTSLSHKIQTLFGSIFGITTCDDDPHIFDIGHIDQAYNDYMRERVHFEAPEPIVTFNQGVLAAKNVDWIIEKVKDLIDWILKKIKGKEKKNPEEILRAESQYIVQLYDDSVESGSCQSVDRELLKKRIQEVREKLAFYQNQRLTQPCVLLSKTLHNYRTIERKLAASEYCDRPEPVVVYVHGPPGCGKSVLSNVLASAYCKKHGLKMKDSVFTTPPGSEYFDGYTGQPVHVIDDFCQNTTGEDVKTFCQMVSTTRFSPPMASLEEKGVLYSSRLILASSNLSRPQSNEVRIPAALERRCHIKVQMLISQDYVTRSGNLDMARAFQPSGPAKNAYFKANCPYLDGTAVRFKVQVGLNTTPWENCEMDVYQLFDLVEDELDRRQGVQESFRGICFESPNGVKNRYTPTVVPFLCNHVDHDMDTCHRVFFRDSATRELWHEDFDSDQAMDDALTPYWEGKVPPKDWKVDICSCEGKDCGKLVWKKDEQTVCVDFRSRSLADYYLWKHSGHRLADPNPPPFKPLRVDKLAWDVEKVKTQLKAMNKSLLISFGATFLGFIATAIGGIIYLVRKMKNRKREEAPYSGAPGQKAQKREHPKQLPVRNVQYEGLPQIMPKVEKNVLPIAFCKGKEVVHLSALAVFGRVVAVNYHAAAGCDWVEFRGKTYKIDELNPIHIYRKDRKTDLVFLTFPDGNQFRDISRFFLSVKDRFPRDDAILVSRSAKMVMNMMCRNVRGRKDVEMAQSAGGEEYHNVITYDIPSMPGFCGAPLLSLNKAREVILGIHFAGNGALGFAVPIYKEDLSLAYQGDIEPLPEPEKKTHVPRKTNLMKSAAHGVFPVTHGPAPLTNKDPRLKPDVNLDVTIFQKHKPDQKAWKELEPAMEYVVSHLMYDLGFEKGEIEPITLDEAINGFGAMDGISMNQSPGYPYNASGRSRRSFFTWDGGRWVPSDELKVAVEDALKNPDRYYFTTFLKDELRPLVKVEAGKTRIVDGDSLPRVLAYRMVFGRLFEAMLRNHGVKIHSAVGCDPDIFWTPLFESLGPDNYDYVFDLDYSCFDSSEPADSFRLMAVKLQPYFSVDIGKYFEALAVSKHVFENKAYQITGGMPSGCVGTSIFNCINNSAFIVSALIALKINPDSCAWICYGDDVLIATNEKRLSGRIAEFYHQNTPLIVTPASKTGDFPETSSIFEVTFLKRYFQPDSHYPHLIHPLMPMDVIQQSVMWRTDGPFQSKLDSLCLLAFHAGGPAYREFVEKVDKACQKRGEKYYFQPFYYLMARWYAHFGL
ncbi:MAG: polyprotein [Megrivirus sp.]|nr:MAG: polyprotein [Megrivirus sp.]